MHSFFSFSPQELQVLWLSFKVAVGCVFLIFIPAIATAWLLARRSFLGKSLLDSLVHLPLVLPPVIPGFLLLLLFGTNGWIGGYLKQQFGWTLAFTWMGAVVASAVMAFPLMVRSVRVAIQQVDADLELAAQSLGAHPFKVFLTITLPLARTGVISGALLAFSRSLGEFGATITFVGNIEGETRTLPLAIYTLTQTPDGDLAALRLALLSMILALGALMVGDHLDRQARRRLKEHHA